ncbi:MAG: hypothetical protein E6Q92_09885 [Burkholderiaceae bacterium]|nr:MAG: hypothetical protein E6Q92_09885 [Burkholderiaceae bacterium]
MRTISHPQNPFLMLMDLESVVQAMEESDRLQNLNRRICRPLDRALLNMKAKESQAQADLVEEGEDLPDDFGHAH